MPLMDEFRAEREALKQGNFRQKAEYFWDYYKWHTIAVVVGVICIWSLVHTMLTAKDPVLNIAMLNCAEISTHTETFGTAYAEYAGIDMTEYDIRLDTSCYINLSANDQTSVNTIQKLMVSLASGDLDGVAGAGEVFSYYAYNDIFQDLREILSEEQLAAYEPYFYYVDKTVVDELERIRSGIQEDAQSELPDPSNPEAMENPVPVAVFIRNDTINGYYYFQDAEEAFAIGVPVNAGHLEHVLKFIDFLMQQQTPSASRQTTAVLSKAY